MASNVTRSIIKTLCYAQIFSYPLTEAELWKYLLHNKKISKKIFIRCLFQNRHIYAQIKDYYVLCGDSKLIDERIKRHSYSAKKLRKAILISRVLFYIPTIKLIGVSGSLSMYNAKKQDDIDLFFITSKNTLWMTRFLVNFILVLLLKKRSRGEKYAQDKICPNMFMSEDSLELENKNLYMAHEIAQMKVLISKKNTYQKFLFHNKWVLRYMPHAFVLERKNIDKTEGDISLLPGFLIVGIEKLCYFIQYRYMSKRITNEKIGKNIAAFHPMNHEEVVTELYNLKTSYHLKTVIEQREGKTSSNYARIN